MRQRLEFGRGTYNDETAVLNTLFSSIEERRRLEFGGGTYNDETAVLKTLFTPKRNERTLIYGKNSEEAPVTMRLQF